MRKNREDSYRPIPMLCRHGVEDGPDTDMEYIGNGDYKCPVCGSIFHDNDYDNNYDDEYISVDEAALIWASNGKDEDYTFGYSEEELEEALQQRRQC